MIKFLVLFLNLTFSSVILAYESHPMLGLYLCTERTPKLCQELVGMSLGHAAKEVENLCLDNNAILKEKLDENGKIIDISCFYPFPPRFPLN